jgi:MerR family transcriptional regulator, thiopeptide resistance regulator
VVRGPHAARGADKSSRRAAPPYSKADWLRIKAEGEQHGRRLVDAFQAGHTPNSEVGMELAEEHRQHITRWFYSCPRAMHRALAELYLADPRFTKTHEDMAPGLAQWVHDAWIANAARHEE